MNNTGHRVDNVAPFFSLDCGLRVTVSLAACLVQLYKHNVSVSETTLVVCWKVS